MLNILGKILSLVASIATAATVAFTSAGNTVKDYSQNFFQPNPPKKEKIDLKIDSTCHYYQFDPTNPASFATGDLQGFFDAECFNNGIQFGNWQAKDLTNEKFFNFGDLKPGDRGEDTISLHIAGANTCGTWDIYNIKDTGGTCTEPETHTNDRDCKNKTAGTPEKNGELMESLEFRLWLDQGNIPGFQGKDKDPQEGDNIQQANEIPLISAGEINAGGEEWLIKDAILASYAKNGVSPGITSDGHMSPNINYYFGIGWELPLDTGNEVQTDKFTADMTFEVEQYRNNPNPFN